MSYDVWLEIDTGGAEPAAVADSINMTSNVAPMWRAAGADLAEMNTWPALVALPRLRAAVEKMENDPRLFKALNPRNRFGNYESCLNFLREIVKMCAAHPKATFRADW